VNAAVITPTQLKEALEAQAATTRRLGQILVDRGFADDDDIARSLCQQYEFEWSTQNRLPVGGRPGMSGPGEAIRTRSPGNQG